jgi:glycogen operon protein
MKIWPGKPYPLGATPDDSGTNFSIFSEVAERVELCLFNDQGKETRLTLPEADGFCWHGYLPGIGPGQRYGYRVHGPWNPEEGHWCNPAKLLIDPYAKAIEDQVTWHDSIFSFDVSKGIKSYNDQDSAPFVPRSVVVNPDFDWEDDRHPDTPLHETVIYEVHLKGFTARHPEIPTEQQGTYQGMGHPAVIEHLTRLGITAVELLPVHQFVHDGHLLKKGLRNYWGYNTISFLAPHDVYASTGHVSQQVTEFKQMVKNLHAAGIEVILDVVYNHTAEGNHLGPTLCFRGIDNAAYYRLENPDRSRYRDYTGTGNSLNMQHPHVLQLIMDSLRYWVLEMRVDGFRFDLAAALARELHEVNMLADFFNLIHQDPVISQVKLIAEPWDVGEGGYQVGNFPPLWSEWNGGYRDCLRDFWRSANPSVGEFASRFTGSSDLYENTGRRPYASINFVTCHDGFTLRDLVSYNEKHNESNGEGNRDGENQNRSWNCGVEGPSDDPGIIGLRRQQQRNFLATLFLSQGVPMLLSGDEMGRTQKGNNNAYCQDNEISWLDWKTADQELLEFTSRLIHFRRSHPVFQRRGWFHGRAIHGIGVEDIGWFTPEGREMEGADWDNGPTSAIGIFLNGKAIGSRDPRGERIEDQSYYSLFNSHHEPVTFSLLDRLYGKQWLKIIDTAGKGFIDPPERFNPRDKIMVAARSLVLLEEVD